VQKTPRASTAYGNAILSIITGPQDVPSEGGAK